MKKLFHNVSPNALFTLGVVTLPAFLFQDKLLFRTLDCLFFLLLALCAGKKIRPLPALVLLSSVTFFALLVPHGKVMANFFGFPITEGALQMGLSRGILLLGLFYLSKFTVVRGLALPGKTGRGTAKVFLYFERFSDNYTLISVRDLPGSLDDLLIRVSETQGNDRYTAQELTGRGIPLIFPLCVSFACWVFLFL